MKISKINAPLVALLLSSLLFSPFALFADVEDDFGDKYTIINGKATIEYYSGIDEDVAKWTKSAIEKAWPMYVSKSGKELNKLVLEVGHVMDITNNDDGTRTVDEPYGITSYDYITDTCLIKISTVKSEKKIIQATAVHELMHCWQYDMRWLSNGTTTQWMAEATAVWTEDWVYDYNTEFEYLRNRFSSFNSDFFSIYNLRDYGSYLYFKFLRQTNKITPEGIFDLLRELKTKKQEEVLSSQSDIHSVLKEYALWNANFDIFQKYNDAPTSIEKLKGIIPYGNSASFLELEEPLMYMAEFDNIYRGGTKYMVISVDDSIDKLVFDTSTFNTLSDEHLSLQALLQIDGKWEYEDWSSLQERTFCTGRAAEDVDVIMLIANHSDLSKNGDVLHKGNILIDAVQECPIAWRGTTTFTKSGGGNVLPMHEELIMNEVLEEITDEDGGVDFRIIEQIVSVNGKSRVETGCFFPTCVGNMGSERDYSGTTQRSMPAGEEWPITRFASAGDGYVFVGTDNIYGECDYVTEHNRSFANCSCPDMGSSSMDSTKTDTDSCHDGPNYEVEIPIEYIPGETRLIQGSTTGDSPDGHYTETITWDYSYE